MFFTPEENENNNSSPQPNNEWSSRDSTTLQEDQEAAPQPHSQPQAPDNAGEVTEPSEQENEPVERPSEPPAQSRPDFQPPYQQTPSQNPYQPYTNYPYNGGYQPQKPSKPPLSNGSKVFIGSMIAVAALVLLGAIAFIGWSFLDGSIINNIPAESQGTTSVDTAPGVSIDELVSLEKTEGVTLSTIEVAAKIKPSVVTITVYDLASANPMGEGSGIIISKDGYIVTNQHVVADGNRIIVTLSNNKTYDASVYATSSTDDIAILKVDASGLTPAEFGDSDKLQIGQFVMTAGNPGGSQFAGSVTLGVVSGTKRISSASSYTTYIQTDAAINPGNSGGPLVNMSGQVVGINSAKIADVEYEGIGFAIPSTEAQAIINDLLQYKYVKGRVRIGITIKDIDPAMKVASNLPSGVTVIAVNPDSDAAREGLAQGDIITHIDGKVVTSMEQLITEVRTHKAGEQVTLGVYRLRNGQVSRFNITVKLMEDRGDLR